MTHFVCISGHAQNGKDTSAVMFKNELEAKGYSTLIVHYADLLKYMCKTFFGWNGEKDEYGRTLLQKVGTDCIRQKEPDYWVDFVTKIVSLFPDEWDYIIVPDARFPNELTRIMEAGFPLTHIRVVRNEFISPLTDEQKRHPSETALDNTEPDYWLFNRGLEQLREDVEELCEVITARPESEYVQMTIFDVLEESV